MRTYVSYSGRGAIFLFRDVKKETSQWYESSCCVLTSIIAFRASLFYLSLFFLFLGVYRYGIAQMSSLKREFKSKSYFSFWIVTDTINKSLNLEPLAL